MKLKGWKRIKRNRSKSILTLAQIEGHLEIIQVAFPICHDLWEEYRLLIDRGIQEDKTIGYGHQGSILGGLSYMSESVRILQNGQFHTLKTMWEDKQETHTLDLNTPLDMLSQCYLCMFLRIQGEDEQWPQTIRINGGWLFVFLESSNSTINRFHFSWVRPYW